MSSTLMEQIFKLRRQLAVTGVVVAGWTALKYSPYSSLACQSGLLQAGAEFPAREEVRRLQSLGYNIPKDEELLYEVTSASGKALIDQTIRDINVTRTRPMDVSRVKYLCNMSVHIGSEYHAGSLKHRAYIVLPGTFGMTPDQSSAYLSGRYFDGQAIHFSLLDSKIWKFLLAKELLYVEDERKIMKFKMILGSLLASSTYLFVFYIYNAYINTPKNMKRLADMLKRAPKEKIIDPEKVNRMGRAVGRFALFVNFLGSILVMTVIYKLSLYSYYCHRTRKIDKTLAGLGSDYISGGEDYFNKSQVAGVFQRRLLCQNKFNEAGFKVTNWFMFFCPKTVHEKDRLDFFLKAGNK